jgi:hypothetical protein
MVDNGLVLLQIHMGLVKVEPGLCTESCEMSCDDKLQLSVPEWAGTLMWKRNRVLYV